MSPFSFFLFLKFIFVVIAAEIGPLFHRESDGSLTAIYSLSEGPFEEIESFKRRLSTALSPSEIRSKLLDKHNQLRARAANGLSPCRCGELCGTGHNGKGYFPGSKNMNALFWDVGLEKVAQSYANKCTYSQNSQRSEQAFAYSYLSEWNHQNNDVAIGENLWISSTGSKVWNYKYGQSDLGISGALDEWFNGGLNYECGSKDDEDSVNRWLQFVFADARFVGCGISICPKGVSTDNFKFYSWANMNIVCNYAIAYIEDKAPYKIALKEDEIASECDGDRIANYPMSGLCGGPMRRDFFQNPQSVYDKSRYLESEWICFDGTDRGINLCEDALSNTLRPSINPTIRSTTKMPTNKPITPQPTDAPSNPTLNPTKNLFPTYKPTLNIVTASPTKPTKTPTTNPPTNKITAKPSMGSFVTPNPSQSPLIGGNDDNESKCDVSDCTFSINVLWESEQWKYKGLVDSVWKTLNSILKLESDETWNGDWDYSWGGRYEKRESVVSNQWVLSIWDTVEIKWNKMQCSMQDYYTKFMKNDEFKQQIQSNVEELMQKVGKVTSVKVSVFCEKNVQNGAFGNKLKEDGKVSIPFSKWNLHSYDFSDWFVLLFALMSLWFFCFCCGWCMHRRKVFAALSEMDINEFGADTPEIKMAELVDGRCSGSRPSKSPKKTGSGYLITPQYKEDLLDDNEENIQIGVSMQNGNAIVFDTDDST